MKNNNKILFLLIIISCLGVLALPLKSKAVADDYLGDYSGVLSKECRLKGNCTLDEFVNYLTFRGNLLLGGVGAFALLMFVIGGVYWIASGGASDKVETGKKIMIGAVIGIIIIFCAWLLIKVLEDTLGIEPWARPKGMENTSPK